MTTTTGNSLARQAETVIESTAPIPRPAKLGQTLVEDIKHEASFIPLDDSSEGEIDRVGITKTVPRADNVDTDSNADGFDDYDGHFDNPTESGTPVGNLSRGGSTVISRKPSGIKSHEVEPSLIDEHKDKSEKTKENTPNAISNNEDFIPFASSSSDEESGNDETQAETTPNTDVQEDSSKLVETEYPWTINHDHSKQREVADWLTLEIRDFVSYISPNRTEIETRNATIESIRHAVKQLWPDAELHVFGSYATDLYLPGSDIDCVINTARGDKENRNSLYQLANHLNKSGLATEIEVIVKTRVPIIKFVEPKSRLHVDVSFERVNGIEAAKLIRNWLEITPGLRELVLVVKQFLYARRLNNVHTGGLGGFSIICLVYTFLHMHPRIVANEIDAMENLGVLLIDFFELYGKNFGYDDVAISVLDGKPKYLPKENWAELHPIKNRFALAIMDPSDPTNNISKGSFNVKDIKKAFAGAFDMLVNRCFQLDRAKFKDRFGKSILGNVIQYRGKKRDFKDDRNLVVNAAIVDNEEFHKKRSRIVYDEEESDNNNNNNEVERTGTNRKEPDSEDDVYVIEEPPLKMQKVAPKVESGSKSPKDNRTVIVLDSDDDDDYDPLRRK